MVNNGQQQENQEEKSSFRKISKDKYILAGVITFLILALGITLGFIIEDHRYNLVEEINMQQDVKYMSIQLQYLWLGSFQNLNNCPILSATLNEAIKELSDSLSEVVAYEEEKNIADERKEIVMRRYVIDNLRYWLLAIESKQQCQMDIVPILYFYSKDCSSCPTQGTILSYYKKIFGEKVLVFPINLDLRSQEPMVDILISQFNITKDPTLIIDNKKYEGVVKKDRMKEIICSSLQDSPECQDENMGKD